jgi:hypothetical protein
MHVNRVTDGLGKVVNATPIPSYGGDSTLKNRSIKSTKASFFGISKEGMPIK